jgi:hypothetical protein
MHLSDHHLVSSLVSLRPEPLPVRKGCKLKKVNWTLFTSHVETALADFEILLLWTPARIKSCAEASQEAITIGLDKEAPIVTFRPKRTCFNWWHSDLEDLKKVTRAAHRSARPTGNPDLLENYHKIHKINNCITLPRCGATRRLSLSPSWGNPTTPLRRPIGPSHSGQSSLRP